MNYLEEYNKLRVAEHDKKTNYNRYLSDITYLVFEEFIMDNLPKSIENTLKVGSLNKKNIVDIKFTFKNRYLDFIGLKDGNYIGTLVSNDKIYGIVNIEEFYQYMSKIPGYCANEVTSCQIYCYKLEYIINYYYEKLQELEYYDIDYKGLTKH